MTQGCADFLSLCVRMRKNIISTGPMQAVEFVKTNFGITMGAKENIQCEFKDENKECLMQKCPHYPYS